MIAFMTHNDDGRLCRMRIQQAAERLHGIFHRQRRLDDTMIDRQRVAIYGRAQVEGAHASIPQFGERQVLGAGSGIADQHAPTFEAMSCAGIVNTRYRNLAEICLIADAAHPVVCPDRQTQHTGRQHSHEP